MPYLKKCCKRKVESDAPRSEGGAMAKIQGAAVMINWSDMKYLCYDSALNGEYTLIQLMQRYPKHINLFSGTDDENLMPPLVVCAEQ